MFSIWIKDYFSDDYIKLDLFPNGSETILVKSQLNNLEKLSNVFSDVSNSFTVPATPHNNKALRHWYDRDIVTNFNANINIPAYTEVGSLPYRWGAVSLEGGQMKLKDPQNYKITFFSKNTQLSDLFGNDLISQLDYDKSGIKQWSSLSQFDTVYNSSNFYASMSTGLHSGNVITPQILITDRDVEWGSANIYDINTTSGAMIDSNFRPALRLANLIDAIQIKYDVTFTGTFFNETHFNKLFIWMNGSEKLTDKKQLLSLDTFTQNDTSLYYTNVSKTNNTFSFRNTGYLYSPTNRYNISVYFYNVTDRAGQNISGTPFVFEIFDQNDVLIHRELKNSPPSPGNLFFNYFIDQEPGQVDYNFKFKLSADVDYLFTSSKLIFSNNFGSGPYDTVIITGANIQYIKPEDSLPKLKVIDFLTGIMKMFKLIIRPISINEFYIDTLDNYYASGNIINIGKFVNIEAVDFKKPEIYTSIKYKYKKTDNVLGKKFRQINDPINDEIGYGDLESEYPLDTKKELNIDLPFENMLFERLMTSGSTSSVNTNYLFGLSSILSEDQRTIEINNCGPILFYNNGTQSLSSNPIYYKYGTDSPQLKNIVFNCGNTDSADINLVTTSINWGAEIDPWHLETINYSLYLNYWSRWINSIYDLRQMRWTYKARLPIRYINEISLNDSLIIGDKRYKIESMTVNLTNGDTTFELFLDVDVYLGIPYNL